MSTQLQRVGSLVGLDDQCALEEVTHVGRTEERDVLRGRAVIHNLKTTNDSS